MVSTLHVIEDTPYPLSRLKRRLAAQARLRTARITIAVSEAQRTWYLRTFGADPQRVTTLPNGVPASGPEDVARGVTLRQQLGVPQSAVMGSIVSLMRPGKGHMDALEALRLIPRDDDVRLVLAGDGPLQPEIQRRVETDPLLRGRVVLAGFVEDVQGLFAASDLVIHPSHFDALPTALIYALAGGVPAVATEVGGIPEIVPPNAGVLVPPGDPQALAAAIAALARDSERRTGMAVAAVTQFRERFDQDRWAAHLRELYASVLDAGS
jgi:glycosyltransferase involved in cell wall biosynthesis